MSEIIVLRIAVVFLAVMNIIQFKMMMDLHFRSCKE